MYVYDFEGNFVINESLVWTGGTGRLPRIIITNRLSRIIITGRLSRIITDTMKLVIYDHCQCIYIGALNRLGLFCYGTFVYSVSDDEW